MILIVQRQISSVIADGLFYCLIFGILVGQDSAHLTASFIAYPKALGCVCHLCFEAISVLLLGRSHVLLNHLWLTVAADLSVVLLGLLWGH